MLRGFSFDRNAIVEQITDQRAVVGFGAVGGKAFSTLHDAIDSAPFHQNTVDFSILHVLHEAGIFNGLCGVGTGSKTVEHRYQHNCDNDPQNQVLR